MRQRLALAQALLGDPDLLVLDEPTAGLDPEQRLRFREVVSQLPNRPTVLLSTHQTEDVIALCEDVVLLAGGVVKFQGPPSELVPKPCTRPRRTASSPGSWATLRSCPLATGAG